MEPPNALKVAGTKSPVEYVVTVNGSEMRVTPSMVPSVPGAVISTETPISC